MFWPCVLSVTNDNYSLAIETLKTRFGDQASIKQEHLQKLHEPKCNVQRASAEIQQNVYGLKNIGVWPDSYETMLIPIYLSRLPELVRIEIPRASEGKEINRIEHFLEFLDSQIRLRERMSAFSFLLLRLILLF